MIKYSVSRFMLSHFYIGVVLIVSGLLLSDPFSFDWGKVGILLLDVANVFWKVVLITIAFVLTSVSFNKKGYSIIAENVGAIGFFFFLFPLMFITHGLPEDIGYSGLIIITGVVVIMASSSFILSKMVLRFKISQ